MNPKARERGRWAPPGAHGPSLDLRDSRNGKGFSKRERVRAGRGFVLLSGYPFVFLKHERLRGDTQAGGKSRVLVAVGVARTP